MRASALPPMAPARSTASSVAALRVDGCDRDVPGIAIPRAEVQLTVRFGPWAKGGLDVHALGGRQSVHRKLLRSGQRVVMARLHLGASLPVLGAPASALSGRIVALEDLWGAPKTRRLLEQLSGARDLFEAAACLDRAIAERLALAAGYRARIRPILEAAHQLARAPVSWVAVELGMSERHLRRVFRETIGIGPKAFAKLTRFRRAVSAARREAHPNWARVAVDAGYYDQAHLISEFRAIAGATPQALINELRAAKSIG